MPIRRKFLIPITVAATVLGLAACGGDDDDSDATGTLPPVATGAASAPAPTEPAAAVCAEGGPEIVIGAQDFGESVILAEIYGQALANAGCSVKQQALGGYRPLVFESFAAGEINFTAEYAASALEFLNEGAGEATGDIDAVTDAGDTFGAATGPVNDAADALGAPNCGGY